MKALEHKTNRCNFISYHIRIVCLWDFHLSLHYFVLKMVYLSLPSVCSQWSRCAHCPWCIGPHCTGIPWALASLPSWHGTSLYREPPLVVTSGVQDWRPVQTCSLESPFISSDIWRLQLGSGQYAFYLNAFLYMMICNSTATTSDGSTTGFAEII